MAEHSPAASLSHASTTPVAERVAPQALIEGRIEPNPLKPTPDEVIITGTGVPVWAVVAHAHALGGDLEHVARDYEMPIAAVIAAIIYYHQNQTLIDARLRANECNPD